MALNGYSGPTSGRITIGGDRPAEIERFYDAPLTENETRATEWFRALSPNEQVREARRLKWNADERERELRTLKHRLREQDAELARLRAKLATFTPEGFKFPLAARDLLDHATAHGWRTGHAWLVNEEDPTAAALEIVMRHGELWEYRLTYACTRGALGHRAGRRTSGLARAPYRGWFTAPANKHIKKIIEEVADTHE